MLSSSYFILHLRLHRKNDFYSTEKIPWLPRVPVTFFFFFFFHLLYVEICGIYNVYIEHMDIISFWDSIPIDPTTDVKT